MQPTENRTIQVRLLSLAPSMKSTQVRYDWSIIQAAYDAGDSWRDLRLRFGVQFRAIQKAVTRGDLIAHRDRINGIANGAAKGRNRRVMSEENRRHLSIRQSLANTGGRCKWFVVAGVKVQGTWERDLALSFERWGICWRRPSKKSDAWPYYLDGKPKHYSPDFYLPDIKAWVEVKGHWWGDDMRKMMAIARAYPRRRIIFVDKRNFGALINSSVPPDIFTGRSSNGRASRRQREGSKFDTCRLHHLSCGL